MTAQTPGRIPPSREALNHHVRVNLQRIAAESYGDVHTASDLAATVRRRAEATSAFIASLGEEWR